LRNLSGRSADPMTPGVLNTFPGFIEPCLPIKAKQPPTSEAWVHEIRHDGFILTSQRYVSGTPQGQH
jgi:ATP-dependent DNA ligase